MRWKSICLSLAFALCWESCSSLRGSDLVLQAKAKAAEEKLNPTTEEVIVSEDGNTTTVVKKPLLTGIPQKDYIHDPNLPRELNGHNLTNYPFYNAVPEDIEFACDGLHDGFYASVPHHCQVYHHCLFGTRYDFLCANYTAFDQKTFICHFVSEVDCVNSPKYFVRNEALYKAATSPPPPTTTTAATTTTTTTTTKRPKRRRPNRRRRPVYEYYYDSEEYDDEYYDDEEEDPLPPPRKSGRKQRPNQGSRKEAEPTSTTTTTTAAPSGGEPPLTRAPASVYARPRVPPKIRPPVPVNERHKYQYKGSNDSSKGSNNQDEEDDEEYYDEEYEDSPPPQKKKDAGREKNNRRRPPNSRKRPSRYEDDDYEEEEDERPRLRKGNRKDDDHKRYRNRKGNHRGDEEEDLPERPMRGGSRKRYPEETRNRGERRPAPEYEYYDDEEEDKYERRRPTRKPDKRSRTTTKKYERTTEAADGEYEEYEEEEDDIRPKKKEDVTTLAPHRFSTSAYKNSKSTTARPSSYRRPKPTEPERRYKPLSKRVETSTEETATFKRPIVMKPTMYPDRKFTSVVGTPAGFKKQEDKNSVTEQSTEPIKEEEKPEPPRRTFDSSFRKQFSNFRRPQEEEKKDEKLKDNSAQRSEEVPSTNEQNSDTLEEDQRNYRDTPSRSQDISGSQSEENSSSPRNPIKENNPNFRKYANRGQDYSTPRSEEISSPSNRYKSENVQNGRVYPTRTQESQVNNEGDSNSRFVTEAVQNGRNYPSRVQDAPSNQESTKSRYKEESVQNGRVYPSRNLESSRPGENSNSYRSPSRNEEQNYRNPYNKQEEQSAEGGTSQYRRPFIQEDRISNFRNPSVLTNSDYRNPPVSNEETNTNFRNQPSGTGNANYRNPHASSDESQFKSHEDTRYSIPNSNEGYRRPENRWPSNEQSQYISVEPSPQPPPIEEVKTYLTGPGADQSQQNSDRSAYPSAVTSPARGYRRYTKMKVAVRPKPVTEESVEYNKYPIPEESPKAEFTAPGPSAPQATPRPYLDLEDYDVTLNDALQPSTPYSRLKSRGYQPAVTHSSYRTGFLLTAASQTYPTKLSGEYEAVVVPAQRFSTKRRPQEWYW